MPRLTLKPENVMSSYSPTLPRPAPPPAVELETKLVLKQCVTARAALAELKQATALIPNPAMLINTLLLLEARASSKIENIVTTADKLFQHLQADAGADPATREALGYRRALLARRHPAISRRSCRSAFSASKPSAVKSCLYTRKLMALLTRDVNAFEPYR